MDMGIAVAMRQDEMEWVRGVLGSDAGTYFDGVEEVTHWYVSDVGGTIEVIPTVGYPTEEPERDGFELGGTDATVGGVAAMLEVMGFPMGDF
jgi:hypothetical protein